MCVHFAVVVAVCCHCPCSIAGCCWFGLV